MLWRWARRGEWDEEDDDDTAVSGEAWPRGDDDCGGLAPGG
jgi:hypothetical protein